MAETRAIEIFAAGPAREMSIICDRGRFRFAGDTGIGFAQPKLRVMKSMARPMMSICLRGLSVSLPATLGVGSPRRYAEYPCAISCRVSEKRIGTARRAICMI